MRYLFDSDEQVDNPIIFDNIESEHMSEYINSMLKAIEKSITRSLIKQECQG